MTEKITNSMDRQWDGYEQILKTPPKPGEPTIKFRDYDGVNGTEVVWSENSGRWKFTGLNLQNIPPPEGSIIVRKDLFGQNYIWSPEKFRWVKDVSTTREILENGNIAMCIRNNIRNERGEIIGTEQISQKIKQRRFAERLYKKQKYEKQKCKLSTNIRQWQPHRSRQWSIRH